MLVFLVSYVWTVRDPHYFPGRFTLLKKSSRVISHVSVELKTNVSKTSSALDHQG